MENDRHIKISAAGSRKATKWPTQELTLAELYTRLQTPVRGTETRAEYLALPKRQQDDKKDVGGFVGGTLRDGVRKAGCVLGRDLVTLDMDHVAAGGTAAVLKQLDSLGCGYAVYSTRKHAPDAPRLRVLIPTDRTVTADEYEPIARGLAAVIDPEMRVFDRTTFEPVRMMYWPSVCADGEYIWQWADKPLVSADGLLQEYADWHDAAAWPQCPDAKPAAHRVAQQADPTGKRGIVGAFCRVYDIYKAMDTFLPGVYDPVDGSADRYTYTGGSTTGGAVVYEDGKFLYSHHATDPCSGQLVNAYDLVRIHKYGSMDDNAQPDTPASQLPSAKAMATLAAQDPAIAAQLTADRTKDAAEAFGSAPEAGAETGQWRLTYGSNGGTEKTTDNILQVLEHDPLLADRMALDTFANRGIAVGPFPWDARPGRRIWADSDDSGLRWYLEKHYQLTGRDKVYDALGICAQRHAFDPVADYLNGLRWDGKPRLDTLFADYLGAADSGYLRNVTRKAFCAAVARALAPGVKFDCMTILTGAQGIGKSTLLHTMGREWFSDSLTTFEGKEARELIQGSWIIEVGELEAMNRTEVGRVKQFLSQREDIFRAAYGRRTMLYPRRCVFFGTSNGRDYLRDPTGARRFWPVDCGKQPACKSVFNDLPGEVDQIWAEAVSQWHAGEPLYLSGEVAEEAKRVQEDHREVSAREGMIREFLAQPVPADWAKWTAENRKLFWGGGWADDTAPLVPRDHVCAMEVWVELLNGDARYLSRADLREINDVLAAAPGWQSYRGRFPPYGQQRGFIFMRDKWDNPC